MSERCIHPVRHAVSWFVTVILAIAFWPVGSSPLRAASLMFSSVGTSGSNLVLSGSGGVPGATYYVLVSTNLALTPTTSWGRMATNLFSGTGRFTNNIPVNPSVSQQFIILVTASPPGGPGLVAAYPFNEGSGTTVFDVSGNGNSGTISGAIWTSLGIYGDALVFNGVNAMVTINNSTSLQLSSAMTLEAWVNPSKVSNVWRDVIYKGNDKYYLEGTSVNGSVPASGGTFGASHAVLYGTQPLATNMWTYLAATYDGATTRLYVNGVEAASQPQVGAIATSTNSLQLGGDSIYGQFFNGTIDEVRIYNRALSGTEIQTDMNTPLGNIPTAPGNLTATITSSNQINLNWTAATGSLGVSAYLVERSLGTGNTNFAQIGAAGGTSYHDDGLIPGTNYNYRVRAADAWGDLGPYSRVVQAFTGLSILPRVAVLTPAQTQQFQTDMSNVNVTWSVDGLPGGSAVVGTITSNGFYTPPNSAGTHTVTATTTNPAQTASANMYVTTNPGVFTFHNDNFRTGENTNETVLSLANVNAASFGKLCAYPLDGLTYSSPLYVANVNIPGQGFHNVVYMATEHDSVYAFDADGLTNAALWHTNFTDPGAGITTIPLGDIGPAGPNIPNEVGITSTPVIDPNTGTIYVVAKTKEVSGTQTNYVIRLHAMDIATGMEKFGGPVVIQGLNPVLNALRENQRTALLLESNVVCFAFGSHGDLKDWWGWVLGYNATNLQRVLAFNPAPVANCGCVWMSGDGPACDAAGNIYFITGNGGFDVNTGGADYGDSLLKISPAGSVLDYFTPADQATLDAEDLDFGSGGELLLPDQAGAHVHEEVSAGKDGTICLVDRDDMGHYNASSNSCVQSLVHIFPNTLGAGGGNYSAPVFYNGYVYFGPVANTVQAFRLTNGLLSTNATSQTSEIYYGRGGTIAISADRNTNGILWTLQCNDPVVPATIPQVPGTLHAYNAANLANELYNSDQAGRRDALGIWGKFTVPVVVNGKVYVASDNLLTIYGLFPDPGGP